MVTKQILFWVLFFVRLSPFAIISSSLAMQFANVRPLLLDFLPHPDLSLYQCPAISPSVFLSLSRSIVETRNGCLFSALQQQRGWRTSLKAMYTNALRRHACAFLYVHTCVYICTIHGHGVYSRDSRWNDQGGIRVPRPRLVENIWLSFSTSSSAPPIPRFPRCRPFAFRPPHSSSSSALFQVP